MQIVRQIGFVSARESDKYQCSSQGYKDHEIKYLVIYPEFSECLRGLETFNRIWIVWGFHMNTSWKKIVHPPRAMGKGYGVFATRSPYRPSAIGLTAVRLHSIEKNVLTLSECDCVDKTPVYDIKPYLAYADSFPDASAGWTSLYPSKEYKITFSIYSVVQMQWIQGKTGYALDQYIQKILVEFPYQHKSSRIRKQGEAYILPYKKWRIHYTIHEDRFVYIEKVSTNYSIDDINGQEDDPINDNKIHMEFLETFKSIIH